MLNTLNTYFGITIDPLHIGAGGYRLGRVDNTIIRDPGTGLPKVPGSSLAGVIRSNAIFALEGEDKKKAIDCVKENEGNCGKCKICKIFGHAASDKQDSSQIGLLRFYDGRIVAFPVKTLYGPVWVTSPRAIKTFLPSFNESPSDDKAFVSAEKDFLVVQKKLDLGWMWIDAEYKKMDTLGKLTKCLQNIVKNPRIALVSDALFGEIVNSCLEVRTSVAIDPTTGAGKSGALFTYEAIPGGTLLLFDIAFDKNRAEFVSKIVSEEEVDKILNTSLNTCSMLGMGGMTTRGFGRIKFESI